jgi:hypothetical protein
VHPLPRVLLLEGHKLKGDREVNQVQVKIGQTEVIKSALASFLNVLLAVVSVPELADNEEIFTLAEAFVESAFNALTCFFLVAVVSCRVYKSVADLDSVVNSISAGFLGNFPDSETA